MRRNIAHDCAIGQAIASPQLEANTMSKLLIKTPRKANNGHSYADVDKACFTERLRDLEQALVEANQLAKAAREEFIDALYSEFDPSRGSFGFSNWGVLQLDLDGERKAKANGKAKRGSQSLEAYLEANGY